MSGSSKSRLKNGLYSGAFKWSVSALGRETCGLTIERVRRAVPDVFLKQKAARKIVGEECTKHASEREQGGIPIRRRNRKHIPQVSTVSTDRRNGSLQSATTVGFFAGEGTNFHDMRFFLGGDLGRNAFRDAQARYAEAIEKDDLPLL